MVTLRCGHPLRRAWARVPLPATLSLYRDYIYIFINMQKIIIHISTCAVLLVNKGNFICEHIVCSIFVYQQQ